MAYSIHKVGGCHTSPLGMVYKLPQTWCLGTIETYSITFLEGEIWTQDIGRTVFPPHFWGWILPCLLQLQHSKQSLPGSILPPILMTSHVHLYPCLFFKGHLSCCIWAYLTDLILITSRLQRLFPDKAFTGARAWAAMYLLWSVGEAGNTV